MLVGLGLIVVAGILVQPLKIKHIRKQSFFVKKRSHSWRLARIYNVISNISIGAEYVIPGILVLALIGNEDILGLITSLTTFVSVILLYAVGRKGNLNTTWKVVALGSVTYFIGTVLLAVFFSPTAVLIYMIGSTIGWAFIWSPSYTVLMEAMDREAEKEEDRYAYICDNELTFNLGRSLGMLLIFVLLSINQMFAMRFVPLIVGITCVLSVLPFVKLVRQLKN
jgi:MFS family permease